MKRMLLTLACSLAPMFTAAQVTVTGNLKNLGHANAAGNNTYARFSLKNYGANLPKAVGSNVIVSDIQDFKPDANGVISGTIQGNDTIDPGATFYQVCIYFQGNQFRCANYRITGTNFDLNSAVPLSNFPQSGSNQAILQVFLCSQPKPATTWNCNHNFNDSPVITNVFDSNSKEIFPDGTDVSNPNTTTLTFVSPQSGRALISHAGTIALATSQPNPVLQNPSGGQTIQGPSLAVSAPITITGPLTTSNLNNVLYADQFTGVDIGAKVNAAYAALPATGGRIIISPQNSGNCYNFSTPIVLSTLGKYARIEYAGSNGFLGTSTPQGCLNYTPTSGAAITLDYATSTGLPDTSAHGLQNILLVNNNCTTFGGCGGTAVAIDSGVTNAGDSEAYYDNVSVEGFAVGYRNLGTASHFGVVFNNPQFVNNGTAILLASPSPIILSHGTYAGNTKVIKTNSSTSSPGVWAEFMDAFNNTTIIDATASVSPNIGGFSCVGCHFEASTAAQGVFISGAIELIMIGGAMEVDTGGGTVANFLNLSGNYVSIRSVQFLSSATVTNILTANGPLKGTLGGEVVGRNFGTPYVAGAQAAFINLDLIGAVPRADSIYFRSLNALSLEVGTGAGLVVDEDGTPPSQAGKAVCYADSGVHALRCSYNAGAFGQVVLDNLPQTLMNKSTSTGPVTGMVASGTANMTTALIAAGACGSTVTVSAAGVTTTDSITYNYNASVGANPGVLIVNSWPTANNVNFAYCNGTAAGVTPSAATLNWSVTR